MVVVAVLLFLFEATGVAVHVAIAVAGILALAVYTAATKKGWKIPALEIVMRACYGIALITGIVIMNVHGIAALAIIHKVGAAAFVVLLVVLFVLKLCKKSK